MLQLGVPRGWNSPACLGQIPSYGTTACGLRSGLRQVPEGGPWPSGCRAPRESSLQAVWTCILSAYNASPLVLCVHGSLLPLKCELKCHLLREAFPDHLNYPLPVLLLCLLTQLYPLISLKRPS